VNRFTRQPLPRTRRKTCGAGLVHYRRSNDCVSGKTSSVRRWFVGHGNHENQSAVTRFASVASTQANAAPKFLPDRRARAFGSAGCRVALPLRKRFQCARISINVRGTPQRRDWRRYLRIGRATSTRVPAPSGNAVVWRRAVAACGNKRLALKQYTTGEQEP